MADSEFTLALSRYIYETLTASSPSIAPVYDDVPQQAEPPYIEIGDATAAPDDDKSSNGETITIAIELFGGDRGRKKCREMAKAVSALLHNVTETAMSYGNIVHMYRGGYSDRRIDPQTPRYQGTLIIIAIVDEG